MFSTNPKVTWKKKSGKLPNNFIFTDHQTKLHLNELTYDMEGTYVCSATNIAGPSQKTEIDVRIEGETKNRQSGICWVVI